VLQLQPVERQTLAKVVMERLLEYVQGGSLQPGDALPSQHELARQLSVSRPVLREAMQGLASVGVIEIRPGSGCYVREPDRIVDPDTVFAAFTHETVLELLEARMVVDVELAVLAAQRATEDDLENMERTLERIKRTIARGKPTSQATADFHQALNRAAHNRVLYRMSQLLRQPQIAQGIRVERSLPDIAAHEYDTHRLLYDAVRRRDPAAARQLMREHLEVAHGWEEELAALGPPGRHPEGTRILGGDAVLSFTPQDWGAGGAERRVKGRVL
jgi:GntR family transcriptional repressor for pyruvate dehydrogenase complex